MLQVVLQHRGNPALDEQGGVGPGSELVDGPASGLLGVLDALSGAECRSCHLGQDLRLLMAASGAQQGDRSPSAGPQSWREGVQGSFSRGDLVRMSLDEVEACAAVVQEEA